MKQKKFSCLLIVVSFASTFFVHSCAPRKFNQESMVSAAGEGIKIDPFYKQVLVYAEGDNYVFKVCDKAVGSPEAKKECKNENFRHFKFSKAYFKNFKEEKIRFYTSSLSQKYVTLPDDNHPKQKLIQLADKIDKYNAKNPKFKVDLARAESIVRNNWNYQALRTPYSTATYYRRDEIPVEVQMMNDLRVLDVLSDNINALLKNASKMSETARQELKELYTLAAAAKTSMTDSNLYSKMNANEEAFKKDLEGYKKKLDFFDGLNSGKTLSAFEIYLIDPSILNVNVGKMKPIGGGVEYKFSAADTSITKEFEVEFSGRLGYQYLNITEITTPITERFDITWGMRRYEGERSRNAYQRLPVTQLNLTTGTKIELSQRSSYEGHLFFVWKGQLFKVSSAASSNAKLTTWSLKGDFRSDVLALDSNYIILTQEDTMNRSILHLPSLTQYAIASTKSNSDYQVVFATLNGKRHYCFVLFTKDRESTHNCLSGKEMFSYLTTP